MTKSVLDILEKIEQITLSAAQEYGVNEPYWSWLRDMYEMGLHPEGETPEHYYLFVKIKEQSYRLKDGIER